MMAVTAVTSTMGFTAESQLGSSACLYQIRYCATVQKSVGPSTDMLTRLSAGGRCGAYMRAAAASRKTTAARTPFRIRSARSRRKRRLGGVVVEEGGNSGISSICSGGVGWDSRPTRYLLSPTPWCRVVAITTTYQVMTTYGGGFFETRQIGRTTVRLRRMSSVGR